MLRFPSALRIFRWSCLVAVLLAGECRSHGQTLTVTPATALVDEPVAIRAAGLGAGEVVSVRSELEDGAGHTWRAEAEFAADATGALDLGKAAAIKGSYRGVSAMGLVWAMRPSGEGRIYQAPRNFGPQRIQFSLRSKEGEAKAELEQRSLAEGVRMVQLQGALHGTLFLPPATMAVPGAAQADAGAGASAAESAKGGPSAGPAERRPALLVVGGSEGGMPLRRAAWLANHGYVALALAYFRAPGLPEQLRGIPLEMFGTGLSWLAQRPEVDPQRIGVLGTSRGGELALQLGSMYPAIHAVVAFVPANVRVQSCCDGEGGAAWTWRGEELAYTMGRFGGSMGSDLRAQIPVENTRGPILLVSGQDDGVWPSSDMTQRAVSRLKASHFGYLVERLDYPKAGHRAGAPEIAPTWHGQLRHPVSGRLEELGGTPEGNAASGLDAGPRVLAFLANSLRGKAVEEAVTGLAGRS